MAILRNQNGSTLFVSLMFSIIVLALAAVYITANYLQIAPAVDTCRYVQARFNAHAGLWRSLDELNRVHEEPAVLKTINTLDTSFANNQFSKPLTVESGSSLLSPSDTTQTPALYSSENFGTAEITTVYSGPFLIIQSEGLFQDRHKKSIARICGSAFLAPETTLYVQQPGRPTGGRFEGAVCDLSAALGTKAAHRPLIDSINPKLLATIVKESQSALSNSDTLFMPMMSASVRHVKSSDECANLPDTIKGPLLIDGSLSTIVWQQRRTVYVLGDVQVTGKSTLKNLTIISSGEIRLLDDATLDNVAIFSTSRIFIGDRAVFAGSAIAQKRIIVYNMAIVRNKSVLVVTGNGSGPKQRHSPADSAKTSADTSAYSLVIADKAVVDGCLVAMGVPGGILVAVGARVSGIVWAAQKVSCSGVIKGVVRAAGLVDDGTMTQSQNGAPPGNRLKGTIARLSTIAEYRLPVFMGRMRLESINDE